MNEGQPVFVRKETPVGRDRIDLLLYFYGSSQFDIVECKGRAQPIIGKHGVTNHFMKAIQQADDYRTKFVEGQCRITGDSARDRKPRIIVIGCSMDSSLSSQQESAIIKKALLASDRAIEYEKGTLLVITWRVLAEKAQADFAADTAVGPDGLLIASRTEINGVARSLLARIVQYVSEHQTKGANLTAQLERLVARNLQGECNRLLHEPDKREIALVSERAQRVLKALEDLQLLQETVMKDPVTAHAALQIADILLYEEDGDLPGGPWVHGATYPLIGLIGKNDKIMDRVTPQLMRILSSDNSEDVIGRASHVARYFPKEVVAAWPNDKVFGLQWTLPNPNELLEQLRQISFLQMGYCLAIHGLADAVSFMNDCAENSVVT